MVGGSVSAAVALDHFWGSVEIPFWTVAFLPLLLLVLARETVDGTYSLVQGREAEGWTRHELARLRRDGWTAVGGIELYFGDVDLVLVGPGGVFAIETKYTESRCIDDDRLQAWRCQAERSADSTQLLLKHNYEIDVDVMPLVTVWARPYTSLPMAINRLPFVRGRDCVHAIRSLEGNGLSVESTRAIVHALRDFKSKQLRTLSRR